MEDVMAEKHEDKTESDDSAAFNRRFKYAVIVFAIVEFIVIAYIVYQTSR